MALKGDTVRLEVEFLDTDGYRIEPDEVQLNIYDRRGVAIQSTSLGDSNRVGEGEYYYDLVIPYTVEDYITYEFIGTHKNNPVLAREKIHVEFV